MAGYIAAYSFVNTLERVNLNTVTWGSFLEEAGRTPIDIPMMGKIDWTNGKRKGTDTLALSKFEVSAYGIAQFVKILDIASLDQVKQH
jgi:hypothetical protein